MVSTRCAPFRARGRHCDYACGAASQNGGSGSQSDLFSLRSPTPTRYSCLYPHRSLHRASAPSSSARSRLTTPSASTPPFRPISAHPVSRPSLLQMKSLIYLPIVYFYAYYEPEKSHFTLMQSTVGCFVVTPPFFNFRGPSRVCNELIALETLLLCMVLHSAIVHSARRYSARQRRRRTRRPIPLRRRRRRASTGRQKLPGAPRRPPTDLATLGACAPRRLRPAFEAPRAEWAKKRARAGRPERKKSHTTQIFPYQLEIHSQDPPTTVPHRSPTPYPRTRARAHHAF